MKYTELTCIRCPLGCQVQVEMENHTVIKITGNTCPKGESYARREVTSPTRTVTTTVKVKNGVIPMVSVKTKEEVPKDKIFDCISALKNVTVEAPVHIGDVILRSIAGTGVDMVATKEVLKGAERNEII